MPINDDISKPIKRIETKKNKQKKKQKKNIETFQMDPINEINSQFAHYVLLDTHMLQMLINKLWSK